MVRRRVGISLLAFSPATLAGQATYTIGVTRALLSRGGHDYVVFVPPRFESLWRNILPADASFVVDGPDPENRSARILFEQWRLAQMARRQEIDTVFFPHFVAPIWKRPRAVVTVHDLLLMSQETDFPWYKRAYHRWSHARLRSQGHHVITVSEFCRRDILSRLGLPAERVSVASPGLDPEFTNRFVQHSQSDDDLPEPYLLSVAGAYPHKRLDVLLDTFSSLAVANPNIHLVLLGTHTGGPDAVRRLRSHASSTPVAARIHFLPRLPREILPPIFARAAALVSSSEFEGFGIPIIEAMALCCPVAASPADAVVEVLGGCGWVAADFSTGGLAAAISEALGAREHDAGKLLKGRARVVASYTWDRAAEAVESVLGAGDR